MRIIEIEDRDKGLCWCLVGLISWLAVGEVFSGDWPQFHGPNQDSVSTDRITRHWSGSVTNPVWLVYLTNGITSLAVKEGRVFTQVGVDTDEDTFPDKEFCLALSATNGTALWSTEVDSRASALYPNGGVGADDGPRSTPTVADGSVYVLSSYLKLHRLNATNGAVIWSTNLVAGLGASVIPWQSAASPVVDNGLVFVNGNAGSQRIMAFRTSNGTLAWRSQNEGMTHSTPVLATVHGVRQLILATQSGLLSLNPQTGTRLWRTNYPFSYSTSLGASPVVYGDMVFVSGAYSMGTAVTRVNYANNVWSTALLWRNSSWQSHWMTPVVRNGFLYGPFGSSSSSPLKCIEMASGNQKWSVNNFGLGGVLLVNDQILGLTERGALVLIQPNTNAYTELTRFQAIPNYDGDANKCWNAPAVADGRVYVRSTAYAAAYDLSVPDLKFDPPQLRPGGQIQFAVRTVDGTPVNANRLAAMEVRASTNTTLPLASWTKLTNALVLTGGVARLTNVDASLPQQSFIVSEPR